MKTTLFYFSATGNCLTTARKMARYFDDCKIISVSDLKDDRKIFVESDTVGFVFPVYYGNMPYPLRNSISKMVFRKDPYIFAFTACRGHVGMAPQRLDQLLRTRAQKLSCASGIKMPGNSFLNDISVDQAYLDTQDQNIADAIIPILHNTVQDFSVSEVLPLTPVDYPNNFRKIQADDTCIGCGLCVKVCPLNNITIHNGKALIGDNCATCLSCFHWCPKEAVFMSNQPEIARRRKYHHPDVNLTDFIR